MKKFTKIAFLLLLLPALLAGCGDSSDDAPQTTTSTSASLPQAAKAVYFMNNDAVENRVGTLLRNENGSLSAQGQFATGGSGSGDLLDFAQHSLFFQANNNRFFTVNAGSNSLTMSILNTDGTLTNLSTVNTGGIRPVSVAAFGNAVYVVNAGDGGVNEANVSGFLVSDSGLSPINDGIRPLSAAHPNPAQIGIHPTGTVLVVTERDTDTISTFPINAASQPTGPVVTASNGNTPGGFGFTPNGILVVAESNDNVANAGSVSSYQVGVNGNLVSITNSLGNGQSNTAFTTVVAGGTRAYTSNLTSNNISGYDIAGDGSLTLIGTGNLATTGVGPTDIEASDDGLFLYSNDRATQQISIFSINTADGSLTAQTPFDLSALSNFPIGMVAR